jgi:hypothetical protein
MSDPKQAWNDVGDRLEALALKLQMHLKQETSEHEAHDEEHRGEIVGALDRLGEAFEDVFEAVENASKDEGIRSDINDAARSTVDALTSTFGELAAEVAGRRFRRSFSVSCAPRLEQVDSPLRVGAGIDLLVAVSAEAPSAGHVSGIGVDAGSKPECVNGVGQGGDPLRERLGVGEGRAVGSAFLPVPEVVDVHVLVAEVAHAAADHGLGGAEDHLGAHVLPWVPSRTGATPRSMPSTRSIPSGRPSTSICSGRPPVAGIAWISSVPGRIPTRRAPLRRSAPSKGSKTRTPVRDEDVTETLQGASGRAGSLNCQHLRESLGHALAEHLRVDHGTRVGDDPDVAGVAV